MITLTKGIDTKVIDNKSSLLPILLEQGWLEEKKEAKETSTKKKEAKDAIPSTTGN